MGEGRDWQGDDRRAEDARVSAVEWRLSNLERGQRSLRKDVDALTTQDKIEKALVSALDKSATTVLTRRQSIFALLGIACWITSIIISVAIAVTK